MHMDMDMDMHMHIGPSLLLLFQAVLGLLMVAAALLPSPSLPELIQRLAGAV